MNGERNDGRENANMSNGNGTRKIKRVNTTEINDLTGRLKVHNGRIVLNYFFTATTPVHSNW